MSREDGIAKRVVTDVGWIDDTDWLVRVVRAARKAMFLIADTNVDFTEPRDTLLGEAYGLLSDTLLSETPQKEGEK